MVETALQDVRLGDRRRGNGRHWLILRGPPRSGEDREEVFTLGGRPAVFSFREEAEAFLGARGTGAGWRVEEFWAEEFASMLHGSLSGFGRLVLDPLPEISDREMDALVSVSREEFLRQLSRGSLRLSPRSIEG